MIELRVRNKRTQEYVDGVLGKRLPASSVDVLLRNRARILKPDGKPLCVYLPGAVKEQADATYEEFTKIRGMTDNRGYASGSERAQRMSQQTQEGGTKRTRAKPVTSSILGAFDPVGPNQYCRLTAYNAKEVKGWTRLLPMFQAIAGELEQHVPERYAAQAKQARLTHPDWIIPETPFTTITVNNTYPTGAHTDKGDLDEGFSTIACIRRGAYTGGWLTFPQYGIAADLQDGDLLLMDAHEVHGNTVMYCAACGVDLDMPGHRCELMEPHGPTPERISIVAYFRTGMVACGSRSDEDARRLAVREERNERALT